MKTKTNPTFTRKFDSCADMLACAGPKVNFSTLAEGDCFVSRDVLPRKGGAIYFKMRKTGPDSAQLLVTFAKMPYWASSATQIPADLVVTSCDVTFGDPAPLAMPF
jgi:hypothetical protein